MIYGVYTLRDKLSGYGQVTIYQNDEIASRNFEMLVHDENPTLISCHPEDYELYCIGSYDSDLGEIDPVAPIKLVMKGESFVKVKK